MAIRTYVKDGQTCYLIKCVAKSVRHRNDPVRKQVNLGPVSLSEARKEHEHLKREVRALLQKRETIGFTWKDLLLTWYRREVVAKPSSTTTKIDSYNMLLAYTKEWMQLPVERISPLSVQLIFEDMKRSGKSRSRMKSLKGAINSVFDWGILERVIGTDLSSPARGASLPKVKGNTHAPGALNAEEIRLFLRKARILEHPFFYVWAVAFNTGCRSGELWALRWSDIDFSRNMISVTKSFSPRLGIEKSTKTDEWRFVPINPQLESLLKELRLLTGASEYVLPRLVAWRRGEAAKVTRRLCKDLGVREINFHATRACFAVQCLERGLGMVKTMKLGGWKDINSFQHYVRLAGVEIEGATDSFDLLPSRNGPGTVHQLAATPT